jgi:hypothetical protein
VIERKRSDRGTRRRGLHSRVFIALLLLLAPLRGGAEVPATRVIELRWQHPGEVAGFRIYTRLWTGGWGPPLDVGLPPKRNGVFRYSLEISNHDATYVALSAYDERQREGALSNERLFLLPEPEAEER